MDDQVPYSKREFDHYFGDMRDKLAEILFDMKEVKIQTKLTNGSVKEHKLYFKILWIGLGILCTALIVILPTFLAFIKHVQQMDKTLTELTHQVQK